MKDRCSCCGARWGLDWIQWISVTERLPIVSESNGGSSEDVLVSDGKSIGIGYYEAEYNIEDDPNAFEGQTEVFSSASWHCQLFDQDPIAWMYLPKLPEKI